MVFVVFASLEEDRAYCESVCVYFEFEQLVQFQLFQDRFCCYSSSEVVESLLFLRFPCPFDVFASELVQWSCDVGKASNEGSIEIAETKEGMDIFDGFWDGPVGNARNFNGVHAGHPLFKNYPQVIYGCHLPHTLFRFKVEVMFFETT